MRVSSPGNIQTVWRINTDNMQSKKNKNSERSRVTREALIRTAHTLFKTKGYSDTGTEEIVQSAGVTRGALYHHFQDKEALFVAVLETAERELADTIEKAGAAQADPWQKLRAGYEAFLDSCMDPAVRRIILLDAPSVLGMKRWRNVDANYGLGLISRVLEALMAAGYIQAQPVKPLAHLLLGALSEAGLMIASAEDVHAAREEVGACLDGLLKSLRIRQAQKEP